MSHAPEAAPDTLPPILCRNVEDHVDKEPVRDKDTNSDQKLRWRKYRVIGLILLGIIAATTGIGVGVGLHLHRDTDTLNASTSSTDGNSNRAKSGALIDTSLAAIKSATGNRHVFFQDVNGSLCHIAFSASQNTWLPSIDLVPTPTPPRKYTPIAVADIQTGSDNDVGVCLFYFDTSNSIVVAPYGSALTSEAELIFIGNSSVPVATDSRSLNIYQLPSNRPPNSIIRSEALLFYENPTGNMTTL